MQVRAFERYIPLNTFVSIKSRCKYTVKMSES